MTRYLTVDELIYINEQIASHVPIHTIVAGKRKVRDLALLETAWGRPMQTLFGQDAYPTLAEKAAALLHSIARNHPFADGNKRTATVAALFMLEVNGLRVCWDASAALRKIVLVAEGQLTVADFAAWLRTEPGETHLEPDAEVDMQIIARILSDQAWLLAELARQ